MKYYVYALLDPRKPGTYTYGQDGSMLTFAYEPFYIGKGTGNRARQHYYGIAGKKLLYHKDRKIQKLQEAGLPPMYVYIYEDIDEGTALQREVEVIALIGRSAVGGPLCNATDGGEGTSGWVCAEETKQKIGNSNKGKIISPETRAKRLGLLKGRTHSESTRRKMSEAHRGKVFSAEHRANLSANQRGRKHSPEHIEKVRRAKLGCTYSEETRRKVSKASLRNQIYYRHLIETPAGEIEVVYCLSEYCKRRNLNTRNMRLTIEGVTNHRPYHKGYRIISRETLPKEWRADTVFYQEYRVEEVLYGLAA